MESLPTDFTDTVSLDNPFPPMVPRFPLNGDCLRTTLAEYRIDRFLQDGGMGAVLLAKVTRTFPTSDPDRETPQRPVAVHPSAAHHLVPGAVVVIKVGRRDLHISAEQLIRREAASARMLNHPRAVPVVDYQLDTDPPFLVMPYYPGGSLRHQISMRGRLSTAEASLLLDNLLEGLAAAQRADVLHLDLKPDNVLIEETGGYVLADFGIARGSQMHLISDIASLGTPAFQAPEQQQRQLQEFDHRTDLWGAGITVWAALTGMESRELYDLRSLHPEGAPPPISQFRPDLPPALTRLIDQMLEPRPLLRPGSAAEALATLRNVLSSENAVAPEDQAQEQLAATLSQTLMDHLWRTLIRRPLVARHLVVLEANQILCSAGDQSFRAYVLLQGTMRIERPGRAEPFLENREGVFLGEVAALTGSPRTASLIAHTRCTLLAFPAAEFEHFVASEPAVAIRLIRILCLRVEAESNRPIAG
jgi:serine/threonine protein kinase